MQALVTVNSGATLGGGGIVGTLGAKSGSTITPGNSIGTLFVAGNASFAAGSLYQVELGSNGTSDLINVAGSAIIANGALLSVTKTDAAPYALGTHYVVLHADGGLTGAFAFTTVQLNNFVGLVGSSDAKNIFVDVTKIKSFASAGSTANQISTATAIDGMSLASPLVVAVANLPTDAAARGAFDQLSGELHASSKAALIEDGRFLRSATLSRLGSDPASGWGSWGETYGSWGTNDSDGNAARVKRSSSGVLVGVDAPVGADGRIGLVGGYGHSDVTLSSRSSSATSDTYRLGIYAGIASGAFGIRVGAAYDWHDVSTDRSIAFAGLTGRPTAKYKAGSFQGFGEMSYKAAIGKSELEPYASLAFIRLHTDAFVEVGGVEALSVQASTSNVTFGTFGFKARTTFDLGSVKLTARANAGWRHAWGDLTSTSTGSFAGSNAFTVAGTPLAKDSAVLDIGVEAALTPAISLGLSYTGQIASSARDNGVKGTMRWRF
jgi:outer membrane autotransporter protein